MSLLETTSNSVPAIPFYVNEVYRVVKENQGWDFELSPYSMHSLLHACGLDENSHLLVVGSGTTGIACLHAAAMYRVQQVVGLETRRYACKNSQSHLWPVLARGLLQSPVFFVHSTQSITLLTPFTHVLILNDTNMNLSLQNLNASPSVSHVIGFTKLDDDTGAALHVREYGSDKDHSVFVWRRPTTTRLGNDAEAGWQTSRLLPPLSSLPFYIDWTTVDFSWCPFLEGEPFCSNLQTLFSSSQSNVLLYLQWIKEQTGDFQAIKSLPSSPERPNLPVSSSVFYYNGSSCEGVPLGQSVDQTLPNVFPAGCAGVPLPTVLPLAPVLIKRLVSKSQRTALSVRERDWLTVNFGIERKTEGGVSRSEMSLKNPVIIKLDMSSLVWYRPVLNKLGAKSYFWLQGSSDKLISLYPLVYNLQTW